MSNLGRPLQNLDEASVSQIPALIQLVNLGYGYLSRESVRTLREGRGQFILRPIAVEALRRLNPDISEKTISDELAELEKVKLDEGLVKASEHIYTDLLCGRGVCELVNGKRFSPQMKFIDFQNPEANVFHVCAEFEIADVENRRPDIVLFVNGIPLAVIECKRGSVDVDVAIDQHLSNQEAGGAAKFYLFPQILVATNSVALKYGTMQTPKEFYSVWKEEWLDLDAVLECENRALPAELLERICSDLSRPSFVHSSRSIVSAQAEGIYCLFRRKRLLELVRNFILYDNGVKKIARYQQFFAIQKTLARLYETPRRGGLIWHTQGSGKSLTMVMLVKKLTEAFVNPRIIIVTDRRHLDHQISETFKACNIKKNVIRAKKADELFRLIREKSIDVITTLVQKFDHVSNKNFRDEDANVFILIDEAHRTQGGLANAWMNSILPNACQIAFTGTPLMKSEKASEVKFGGRIDAYTISEAEADGAILPLVYQAMFVDMRTEPEALDRFYGRLTRPLTESQRRGFERRCVSSQVLAENSSRIEIIAASIVEHYRAHFQGSGLKGQVVMPSKYAAVVCKEAMDLLGGVRAEVIISDAATEEGSDNATEQKKVVAEFLAEAKQRYGSLDKRELAVTKDFIKNPDGVELLIVVDKLLTGFDAPRNTVLYLAKQLKDHNLLQAIARVNRLFRGDVGKPEKESGIIIDYSKNAQNLCSAMELFSNYNREDVERALISVEEKTKELENVHAALVASVAGKSFDDNFDYFSANERERNVFYEQVNRYISVFSTCMALPGFSKNISQHNLSCFCKDLKHFVELKRTLQLALAEKVDFSKYRDKLHRILDRYIHAEEVEELSKTINLSDIQEFNRFVDDQKNGMSSRSKAEAIAAQVKKVIREKRDKDEAFYGKFSDKIEQLLEDLKTAKKNEVEDLLALVREVQRKVGDYEDSDIPVSIRAQKDLHPYYRNLKEYLPCEEEEDVRIVSEIADVIYENQCVDWDKNRTVELEVKDKIDDYLYDEVVGDRGINLDSEKIKKITDEAWNIAVRNKKPD